MKLLILIFPLIWIVHTYLSFFHVEEGTAMFLKGDENVSLTIDTEFFDETIIYEGSAESTYLAKKYLLGEEVNIYSQLFSTEKRNLLLI